MKVPELLNTEPMSIVLVFAETVTPEAMINTFDIDVVPTNVLLVLLEVRYRL